MHVIGYGIYRRQRLSHSLKVVYRELYASLGEPFREFLVQRLHIGADIYVQDSC